MFKVRNLLLLIFCLIILETSNANFTQEITTATNQFSLDLLKIVLQNKTNNIVVSPVSIYILLAILQQGARGNTKQEVDNVVHAQPELTKLAYNSLTNRYKGSFSRTELEFSTRAFAGTEFQINSDFRQTLISDFQSGIDSVNFADSANASDHINSWVSQATHLKINQLIGPDDIDAFTRLVLVNAIYFQSYWDFPFQSARNKAYSPTNGTEIHVPTLSLTQFYHAGECSHLGAKYVHLNFVDHEEFSVLLLLPTERYGLDALLNRLTAENLTNIFNHNGIKRVNIQFPKFSLKSTSELGQVLRTLGVNRVFAVGDADLSGMTNESLALSRIFQKAEILADEDGVTAAAATGFTYYLPMGRYHPTSEQMDFIADHPFLFFIVDRTNHVPLFAGRVTNPFQQ